MAILNPWESAPLQYRADSRIPIAEQIPITGRTRTFCSNFMPPCSPLFLAITSPEHHHHHHHYHHQRHHQHHHHHPHHHHAKLGRYRNASIGFHFTAHCLQDNLCIGDEQWWWWSCDYIYYWKYRHGCIWARTKRGLVLISWFHSSATLSSDSTLNTKLNLSNRTIVSWCLSSTFDYKIIDQLEFFKKLWKNDRNREKNKWKSQEWKTLKVKKGRKFENCEVERKWEKKERSGEERVTQPPVVLQLNNSLTPFHSCTISSFYIIV